MCSWFSASNYLWNHFLTNCFLVVSGHFGTLLLVQQSHVAWKLLNVCMTSVIPSFLWDCWHIVHILQSSDNIYIFNFFIFHYMIWTCITCTTISNNIVSCTANCKQIRSRHLVNRCFSSSCLTITYYIPLCSSRLDSEKQQTFLSTTNMMCSTENANTMS